MPLENSNTVAGLNPTWPLGSDPKSQGDDHLRLIKDVLQKDAATLSGDNQAALIGAANVFTEEQTAPRWRASAGGAALPGFAFEGDGSWNSGIWENGSNVLCFGVLGALSYTMRVDGQLSAGTDVITRSNGDERYAQLDDDNTFTGIGLWSTSSSTSQIQLKNTNYGGNPGNIGQRDSGAVRVNSGIGTVYDFSNAGEEYNLSVLRRSYADTRYARLDEANTFSGSSADTFEGEDSTKQVKLKNTGEAAPAFIGQMGGLGIRMIVGSTSASGTVYDCEQSGSETSSTMVRRTYGDGRYQRSSSDAAKKENVVPLGDVGDMIDALQPCEYTWKADEMDPQPEGVQIGAIAQEVEAVLPAAVGGEDGNKSIDLRPVVWALVKEVQMLRQRVAVVEA